MQQRSFPSPYRWNPSQPAQIDAALQPLLASDQEVPVLILFREQVDAWSAFSRGLSTALSQAGGPGLSAARDPAALRLAGRSEVVRALQDQSARTQAALRSLLQNLTAAGDLRHCRYFYVINAMAARANRSAVEALARDPSVAKILPDETITLNPIGPIRMAAEAEPAALEWNVERVGAPSVWQLGYDGSGVVVASIDTGVEYAHPALQRQFRGYDPADPANPTVEGNWFDAVSGDQALPYDDNRHGTHVTGTMVGATADGSRQIGVAPGAQWIAVKAFNATGQGQASWLLAAGEWVLAPQDQSGTPHPEWAPDVVNNSWGGGAALDEWYRPVVENWRAASIVPVCAAGNGGSRSGSVSVPGNYPESFTVGAIDSENLLASFSGRGPSPYDEIKPEVVAPGVAIRSAVPGGGYELLSGTSMATPHVSGAVALLLSAAPDRSVDEVETLFRETAVTLTDDQFPESPNNGYGNGLIDVFAAATEALAGRGTIAGRVTVPGEDTVAPTVTHTPVASAFAGMPIPVTAEVADEVGVAQVSLLIQSAASPEENVVAMARTEGDHLSGRYEGSIPANLVTTAGLSYSIRGRDAAGNDSVSGPHTVAVQPGLTVGYRQDFESEPEGFTTGGVNNPWEWGSPRYPTPVSGERLYGTGLDGFGYSNQTNAFLMMPPIDLTGVPQAQLRYHQWYEIQAYSDFGDIHLSTDGGESWQRVLRQSGSSGGWQVSYLDLSPYAGQTILLLFNLLSDRLVNGRGWFLDDLAIIGPTGEAPAPPTGLGAAPTPMGSVHLTWSRPERGEIGRYRVLRSDSPEGTFAEIGQSTTRSFYDNTAPQGVASYYQVVAEDIWGLQSAPSAQVSAIPTAVTFLFTDDMESGPGEWTTATDRNQWEWGEPADPPGQAYSGTKLWATRLNGSYADSVTSWLLSPPISLVGQQSAALQFAHWYHTEFSYDLCDVEVSVDNGVQWDRLARYSGLTDGWTHPILDLTPYVGEEIRLRFRFTSDYANRNPGWYIDDVRVAAVAVEESRLEPPADQVLPKGYEETPPAVRPSVNRLAAVIRSLPVGATVTVRETGRSVQTDPATGEYAIRHAVGSWTVVAEAHGYRPEEQQVTVGRDQTVTADFTLEPLGQGVVEGSVTHAQTGEPVSGVTVRVLEDDQIAPVQTGADGRFRLELPAGTFTLAAGRPHFYRQRIGVTVTTGETVEVSVNLAPFIAGESREIAYDDGSLEGGFAWNEAGSGWAVRMQVEAAAGVKLQTGRFLLGDTSWPQPGSNQFAVAVYDSDGPDATPGTLLAAPQPVTGRRDGQWSEIDLSGLGLVLQRDFYLTYLQVSTFPEVPALATDTSSPYAGRSWQFAGSAWAPAPAAEGNRMIRALVRQAAGVPRILSPADGSHTAQVVVEVRGEAPTGLLVAVYRDGVEVGRTEAVSGSFTLPLELTPGRQSLTARVVEAHGQGPESEPVAITLDQTPPTLTLTHPPQGVDAFTTREAITVAGQATDDHGPVSVQVNGQIAAVEPDGRFSHRLALSPGMGEITVTAVDAAGNAVTQRRTLRVELPPMALQDLLPGADLSVAPGQSLPLACKGEPGGEALFLVQPVGGEGGPWSGALVEEEPGRYRGSFTVTPAMGGDWALVSYTLRTPDGRVGLGVATGRLRLNR
ncbi:MAG: S8 family serine peptidase [Bacillota bacterium]